MRDFNPPLNGQSLIELGFRLIHQIGDHHVLLTPTGERLKYFEQVRVHGWKYPVLDVVASIERDREGTPADARRELDALRRRKIKRHQQTGNDPLELKDRIHYSGHQRITGLKS